MEKNNNLNMSIIVPIYNSDEYLPACIESLMCQGNLRLEIILVDDGSTDQSGLIADQYAERDNRIKVIHKVNGGISSSRNAGLEIAQGEYIAFVDSDDWVKEECYKDLYREAIKYEADVVMGGFMYYCQNEIIDGYYKPAPKEIKNIPCSGKEGFIQLSKAHPCLCPPMMWSYICRRTFLENINVRFAEDIIHEDELWTPVVLCQAPRMVFADIDFYFYRQREGSFVTTFQTKRNEHLRSLFLVVDRLFEFADRFSFSGEDRELKSWLYVHIYKIYAWTLRLASVKDSSYLMPVYRLDRFLKDCPEMLPEQRMICKQYFRQAEIHLINYNEWRTSEWVASVNYQLNSGKKLMLIYNMIWNRNLTLKVEDVPDDWLITTDRRYLKQAEAVVFYLPSLYHELDNDLDKPDEQVWVSWYLEEEKDDPFFCDPEMSSLFDIRMNYSNEEAQIIHPIVCLCRKVDEIIFPVDPSRKKADVLYLSISAETFGASRAAYRIHSGLRQHGIDSVMLVQSANKENTGVYVASSSPNALTLDQKPLQDYPDRTENVLFSPAIIGIDLQKYIRIFNPEIIQLHWISWGGFICIEDMANIKQKIVWRLPDYWAMTGGCHFPGTCKGYMRECGKCPQLGSHKSDDLSYQVWQRKYNVYNNLDITVVVPTLCMKETIQKSSLLGKNRIEVIPNGMDIDLFSPVDKDNARKKLELPLNKKIILYGAYNAVTEPRKGFSFLFQALQRLSASHSDDYELVVFGASEMPMKLNMPVRFLGFINEHLILQMAYSAADVMVVPSIDEPFGQTVTEAMAHAVPVVVFSDTGPANIIDHQINGYVAKHSDSEDLANGIEWVLNDDHRRMELSRNARQKVLDKYDIRLVAEQYARLYNSLK